MKIAAISTSQVPSNTANSIQVMKVCQALVQNGHEVRLFLPQPGGAEWDALAEQYGLSALFAIDWLHTRGSWRRFDFAWQAVARARAWRADWVYTWTVQAAVLSLLGGRPALMEVHDRPTGRLGPFWLRAFLRVPGKKRLAVITDALRRTLERVYGGRLLPPEQLLIAPNGVELERYLGLPTPAEARRQLGLAEGITACCTGHLYAGRGGELFLGLARRYPQAQFLWVGGRPEDVESYRSRAQEAGLGNVTFTGFIPNARLPLYQAAGEVLLMPYGRSIAGSSGGNSVDIASPMKLFDYLAAGRAILSSDLPVIREVLDDTRAAFAAPDDLESWSNALGRLLSDEAYRATLAAQARESAPRYDWRAREARILADL